MPIVEMPYGFVLRLRPFDTGDPAEKPHIIRGEEVSSVHHPRFQALIRPQRTTPESESEQQPILTPRVVLMYTGRVDNRGEIGDLLGQPKLRDASDGVVLARSYEAWGPNLGSKVIGEYAVALIDRTNGHLVAVRDSLGIASLYRYQLASDVWIASDLLLLRRAMPGGVVIDERSLADYFARGGLLTTGRTIFRGVVEIPPAHMFEYNGRSGTERRYWHPDPNATLNLASPAEYEERFRDVLFDAVRAALRANGPVWSDLSGGLDSSTVTGVAALVSRSGAAGCTQLGAFSYFSSMHAGSDERTYQDAFLDLHPLHHVRMNVDSLMDLGIDEPPSAHPSMALLRRPVWAAGQELFDEHGVVVHLRGKGGDPLFCGDSFPPLHLADLLRSFKLYRWSREVRHWSHRGDRSLWNLVWLCSLRGQVDPYGGQHMRDIPNWLTPQFGDRVREATRGIWNGGERLFRSPARELQYRSVRATAASPRFLEIGVERFPLLARPVVEFALALPWTQLLTPDTDRVIQRRSLTGVLPDLIRDRRTKGSATANLLRALRESWHRIQPIVHGRHLEAFELVQSTFFYDACQRMRHGLIGRHLMYFVAALSLEIWLAANDLSLASSEANVFDLQGWADRDPP